MFPTPPNIFSINALHNFLVNDKSVKFSNEFGMKIDSLENQLLTINYNDCSFCIDEKTKVTINDDIQVSYSTENNNVSNYALKSKTFYDEKFNDENIKLFL